MSLKLILLSIIIETFILIVSTQINLAPQGVAVQRTNYLNRSAYFAHVAIEGPATNKFADGCSITDEGQTYAWWGLQLPAVAFMTNILIYYREYFAVRMDEFSLYLENGTADQSSDSGLCYTDKGIPGYPDITQNITCNMLARNVYFVNRRSSPTCFIELCYVAIYGCWKGTWGTNCTTDCPDECIDRHCFPNNGSCVWGCHVHRCFHGECDSKTDLCTNGCLPGRGGRYCTFYDVVYNRTTKQSLSGLSSAANALTDGNITSCISTPSTSLNSYIQIGNESLIVITGVYLVFGDTNPPIGIHKVYCSNSTDSWADGIVLYNAEYDNEDIPVFAVCKYVIYIPPILNGNSKIDVCEIEIGGCPYGNYGDSCQLTCSKNCMGPCDVITGNCLFGCSVGWLGEKCDRACDAGKFGSQCLRDCSANCLSSPCDHMTGRCEAGCMKGWEGLNCTEESRKGIDNSHSNSNEQHYDDIMKMEGVSTYQDLAKQTVTLSNDYDQINNSYTNQ